MAGDHRGERKRDWDWKLHLMTHPFLYRSGFRRRARGRPGKPGGGKPLRLFRVAGLHFDGTDGSTTFTDVEGKTWTAAGLAQIDTAQSKFGGASGLFDNSLDYISTPNHADFDFADGEFELRGWVRFHGLDNFTNRGLVCHDAISGTRGWLGYATPGPTPKIKFQGWVGATPYEITGTTTLVINQWYYVVFNRDQSSGDLLRVYLDGVQEASVAITGSIGNPSEPCVFATLWDGGSALTSNGADAWLDDWEIFKGSCGHRGGTTFSVPTAAFT